MRQEHPSSRRRVVFRVVAIAMVGMATAAAADAQRPEPRRIVAVGDLHGDLGATREVLRLAGLIDSRDRWTGGSTVLVQTGDLVDRGNDEPAIFALFQRLGREASRAGGAVRLLNGNHEIMNAYFDFRYTTDSGFRSFPEPAGSAGIALPDSVKPEQRGRALAFRPGGSVGRVLATHPIMLVVGGTAFAHGGILPEHARIGINAMNAAVQAWLRGGAPEPAWARDRENPTWTRLYSKEPDAAACDSAAVALALIGARRMVVGHSIQKNGITSYCGGAVWAIDTGMSAFSGGPIQAVEIRGDSVRVLGDPAKRRRQR